MLTSFYHNHLKFLRPKHNKVEEKKSHQLQIVFPSPFHVHHKVCKVQILFRTPFYAFNIVAKCLSKNPIRKKKIFQPIILYASSLSWLIRVARF